MNDGLPTYVTPRKDDPDGHRYLLWSFRNPCTCLMNMEEGGCFRIASGLSLMAESCRFYEKLLAVPSCALPTELKGIAV